MRNSLVVSVIAAVGLLAGCASEPSLLDSETGGTSVASLPGSTFSSEGVDREYRINAADRLSISIYPDKTLTLADVRVDANGSVLVPPLGIVKVEGRTTAEAGKLISDGLAKCCLRSPQVAVQITEAISQQFTVTGAVKTPNTYAMKGKVGLLQAVSMAGGPDPTVADTRRVGIIRTINGQRAGKIFNLQDIMAGRDANPDILPGDEVIVDSSKGKGAWKSVMQALPLATLFAIF